MGFPASAPSSAPPTRAPSARRDASCRGRSCSFPASGPRARPRATWRAPSRAARRVRSWLPRAASPTAFAPRAKTGGPPPRETRRGSRARSGPPPAGSYSLAVKRRLVVAAADALAYYVGRGSEARFVAMMNTRARQLGLRDTHYTRPDGLDAPGHVSSARDVTKLARLLMRHALVRSIVRRQSATIAGGRVLRTWNDLLATFPGVFGVKTGHTSAAGWNEVASLDRRGVFVYGTILGSPDRTTRNADLSALLRWALSRYRRIPVLRAGHVYAKVEVGYGQAPVDLVPARGLIRPVRIDQPLLERVVAMAAVALPVLRGERLGEIRVYQGPRLVARQPLVAGRTVKRPGALGRAAFYGGRTLDHMWGWLP